MRPRRVVLVGDSGSGKSALLRAFLPHPVVKKRVRGVTTYRFSSRFDIWDTTGRCPLSCRRAKIILLFRRETGDLPGLPFEEWERWAREAAPRAQIFRVSGSMEERLHLLRSVLA